MKTRKQMKRLGRESLKRHYVIFVAACLIAAFLAAEFTGSLNFSTAQNYEETYEQVQSDLNGEGTYRIKTKVDSIGWADVIRIMTEDNMQAGREMSREIRENAIEDSENGNPMFGRTRGVLSNIVNQVSSGSIIVTALTIIMAIIQFAPTAWMNVVYVIILTVSIEMILGNIIDPRIQGVQLNMSPLMILISLSVWGYIWGLPGMFLAVPIMSIIQIVCAIVPSLKPVAVLLSSGKSYIREYRMQEQGRRRKRKVQDEEPPQESPKGDIILPEGDNPKEE